MNTDERIYVRIVGNHPHSGETGYMNMIDGKLDSISVGNRSMWRIVIEDCKHGYSAGCYAAQSNMKFDKKNLELLLKYYQRRETEVKNV